MVNRGLFSISIRFVAKWEPWVVGRVDSFRSSAATPPWPLTRFSQLRGHRAVAVAEAHPAASPAEQHVWRSYQGDDGHGQGRGGRRREARGHRVHLRSVSHDMSRKLFYVTFTYRIEGVSILHAFYNWLWCNWFTSLFFIHVSWK